MTTTEKKSFGCQFTDWFFPKTQQIKFSRSLCTNYRNSCCNFCFALETLEENLEAGCLLRRFPIEESIIHYYYYYFILVLFF